MNDTKAQAAYHDGSEHLPRNPDGTVIHPLIHRNPDGTSTIDLAEVREAELRERHEAHFNRQMAWLETMQKEQS